MHKALYRKWRPQIFEDVIGQDYIVTVLKNQVATGKVGHAYLFTGSRGTGKTTCAKIFSKAVNCECNVNGDPCRSCHICQSVGNGSAIDVVEIDAASHTGVDNIRDIIEESAFLPAVCKYRVYIIDEAHMLSTSAFNALLKIMEEPPAHVIFILATTEVHQVPVTIISRCQRFDFSRIEDSLIVSQLLKVADGEGIQLDEDAAEVIARLADGGMRDALSLFDQCASFDNHVTRSVVSKVSGQADRSFILEMAEAVANENAAVALKLTRQAHSTSLSFSFITSELISFYRDVMIAKSVGCNDSDLFAIGTDLEALSSYAAKMSLSQIMFCLDTLSETLNTLGKSAYPNVLFEQCMIKLCSPFLISDPEAILARLEKLEKRLLSVPADFSPFAAPVKSENMHEAAPQTTENKQIAAPKAPEAPKAPAAPAATPANGKQPFELWDKVLSALSLSNPPLLGALRQSKAYIENDIVYIDTNDFSFAILKGSEQNKQSLKSAVAAVSGKPLKIAQYKENTPSAVSNSNAMAEILKRAARNGVDIHKD
ncbi:MAG: DNA polymerase III subunit gamma/tau [Oscillospiraceae bacterium]|nr:DNA polymerase III subunit gamma/tau [Oscillospiraceae bacterium]